MKIPEWAGQRKETNMKGFEREGFKVGSRILELFLGVSREIWEGE